VSDKTRWEGRDQQLGARIRIVWTLFRALGSAKENICALESLKGYIVSGCWELKRKFQLELRIVAGRKVKTMRKMLIGSVLAVLFALLAGASAFGGVFTVDAVADTYITEHPNLGGPSSVHGGDQTLFEIGSYTYESYPLIRFDLSAFAGQTVIGPGSLKLNVESTWSGDTVSQTIEALAVLIRWDESTVSWNSFGPGPICGTNVSCVSLDTVSVTVSPGSVVTFSNLPSTLLQQWINNPAANYGLLLMSTTLTVHEDITFASRESMIASGPELTFQTTPEPSTLLLMGSGFAGLVSMLRRKINP
jgi:hypothetical protein